MPENVYLKNLRGQYDGIRASIQGFQDRAAEANRDLTDDELRSVREQGVKAKDLFTQIEDLTEIETRNAKVAEMAANIATATAPDAGVATGDQTRALGITAKERDPGHYRSEKDGGKNSFFRDLTRAREHNDPEALRRLAEHQRALDTGTEGVGTVPPRWLVEEFELLARQGRALASAVRNIPLGDDPRPLTLPKQTAGTDSEITEQASENTAVEDDDAWDSDVDTVTPKPTAGIQVVSRQMLDMSSPAIDQLIYGDMISAYNLKVEKKVGAAIEAIGSALAATTDNFYDIALDAAITVRGARKMAANVLAMTVPRYGEFLKLKDGEGRPLMPGETAGPMNVIGVGTVAVDGRVHGLGVIATEGMSADATFAVARTQDVLLFESNMLRFRYEQPLGPESIKLGIWGYTAVLVRQGTAAVKKVTVA